MPSLTAELLGTTAAVLLLLAIAITVDPKLRARRAANRLARKRRHAAAGCRICRLEVEAYDDRVELDKFQARVAALAEHVEERLAATARDDRGDGVIVTALVLLVALAVAFVYVDPTVTADTVITAIEGALK